MKITDTTEAAPQAKFPITPEMIVQPPQPGEIVRVPAPGKWEYYTIRLHTSDPRLRTGLNELGAAGWELISLVPCLDAPGMVAGFLKRMVR